MNIHTDHHNAQKNNDSLVAILNNVSQRGSFELVSDV